MFFMACLLLGLLVGEIAWVLLIGSLGLLAWNYSQLVRLNFWLWQDKRLTPPNSRGSWERAFNGIYRRQKKNRQRMSRLVYLLGRFRQGAEAFPDAAVVLDTNHTIIWCNKLAQQLLGLVWPLDQGQRIDNLLRHPDFGYYLQRGKFSEPLELASHRGKRCIVEIRIMSYGAGQFLLIARDITHARQLEGLRKDFVANLSHELKTPLTVLQGYLEMMQTMAEPDSPNIKAMDQMQQQTLRMRSMVEQLLVLSKIESSAQSKLDYHIDMAHMMRGLEEEAIALSQGQHELIFFCESGLGLNGNEDELRSACSNLISNGIHYTPAGGSIDISWRIDGDNGVFSVSDSGDGIAPQHLSRLTERFYRVDRARGRKTGGSGLGLAITKHALSHHYSELKIESTIGQGSTFSFVIPANLIKINS